MSKDVKIKLLQTCQMAIDGVTVHTYSRGAVVTVPEVMAESMCLNSDPPLAEVYDEGAEAAKLRAQSTEDTKKVSVGKNK